MITSEIYLGTISIVTHKEGRDLLYTTETIKYSKDVGAALLYHKDDYYIDIGSKRKYKCSGSDVGDKFVNLKKTFLSFEEVLTLLYGEKLKQMKIGTNVSERKVLKLLNKGIKEQKKYEKSI